MNRFQDVFVYLAVVSSKYFGFGFLIILIAAIRCLSGQSLLCEEVHLCCILLLTIQICALLK
jgi:hypothetical protein